MANSSRVYHSSTIYFSLNFKWFRIMEGNCFIYTKHQRRDLWGQASPKGYHVIQLLFRNAGKDDIVVSILFSFDRFHFCHFERNTHCPPISPQGTCKKDYLDPPTCTLYLQSWKQHRRPTSSFSTQIMSRRKRRRGRKNGFREGNSLAQPRDLSTNQQITS